MTANTINYFAFPGTKYIYIPMPNLTPEIINDVLLRKYGIEQSQLTDRYCRRKWMIRIRYSAMYLLKKHTKMILKDIGKAYGVTDHSSVIHANQCVRDAVNGFHHDLRLAFVELEQTVMYDYLKKTKFEQDEKV